MIVSYGDLYSPVRSGCPMPTPSRNRPGCSSSSRWYEAATVGRGRFHMFTMLVPTATVFVDASNTSASRRSPASGEAPSQIAPYPALLESRRQFRTPLLRPVPDPEPSQFYRHAYSSRRLPVVQLRAECRHFDTTAPVSPTPVPRRST